MRPQSQPIWIDLDNSPHVPFFRPIIRGLEHKGYRVLVTARDAYNVVDLIRLHRLECSTIGRHYGKNKFMKTLGLAIRATQLLPFIAKHRPALAVSHGSRAQILASAMARIPSVALADYEHVTHFARPDCLIVPEIIPSNVAGRFSDQVLKYPGIKEDVYASSFVPDASLPRDLALPQDALVVTVRPPASEAHYHCIESDELFAHAMDFLLESKCTIVLLPRNEVQRTALAIRYSRCVRDGKIIMPERAVEGLNLVWHSDLVISGGGTMNREAAALGVPVYSTFRGPRGAVDDYLASKGRLVLLESAHDVRQRIALVKRERSHACPTADRHALDAILGYLVAAYRGGRSNNARGRVSAV
jgi:predicted glycosyltransferase